MAVYIPDCWSVVKIIGKESGAVHYRVFGSWLGGYAVGESWKMNSGIVRATLIEDKYWEFLGFSGSVYLCNTSENCYRFTSYTTDVFQSLRENCVGQVLMVVMPEETDWSALVYN